MMRITLAPPEPRDKSTYSKMDILLDNIEPIKSPFFAEKVNLIETELEDIIEEDENCEHNYVYFGHDHNTDYVKCSLCGHFKEE